tara:strand:- start:1325 stop:2098 length:774 start_codon:yes stop_codon:yes gene_type:complete
MTSSNNSSKNWSEKYYQKILPNNFLEHLKFLKYFFLENHLVEARNQYKYSDEHKKFVHILEAVNYLKVAGNQGQLLPQTYFEFGCHSGRTFIAAVNASNFLKAKNIDFYAFDSFKGLPSTNSKIDGIFKSGTFNTSLNKFNRIVKSKTRTKLKKENIIEGFYENSLTKELQIKMPKIGIAHIDVDLYSSTVKVLEFITPLLVPGSVILFDDWYCFPASSDMGERKAFNEFLEKNINFKVEEWKAYSTFGKSFLITNI